MKFSGLPILLALAASALGASDVFELDAASFDTHLADHSIVLAEFFAPWCGHCKNLAPEYEAAAELIAQRPEDITLAKIDCVENEALCAEKGIRGFPTLYVYENGEQTGTYAGGRKAQDIADYLVRRAQPAVTALESAKALEKYLSDHNEIVYAFFGPEDSADAFQSVALQNRDKLSFVSVIGDSKLAKKYGGSLVVFRPDENAKDGAAPKHETRAADDSELSSETVARFVAANAFPTFGELGPETYAAYIESNMPLLYAFVEDAAQRELVKKALTPHVDALHGQANIVFLDASVYPRHAGNVNLREEFPAIAVHDLATNHKYVHSQDEELTQKSIAKFVTEYLAGKLERNIKSEAVPESQDEPVYTLVGSEYEKVVLGGDKDVLVEFYAPWCGHCKKLAPEYVELGELFADSDDVVIAKIDHTQNEVPVEITGYPTIMLFPAGKKDAPVEFQGTRDAASLAAFVEENGSKGAKAAKPKPKAEKAEKADEKADEKKEL